MVIYYPFLTESPPSSGSRYKRDIRVIQEAQQLYEYTCHQGWLNRLWGLLTQRERNLLNLTCVEATGNIHSRHFLGMRTVLVKQICGSEGRSTDFDARFFPRRGHSRERWVSIAAARIMGLTLPPVELIQIGDGYFVRDGHHRISVVRVLGEEYIEAEVTVWQVSGPLPWQQSVAPVFPQPAIIVPLLTARDSD